MFGFKGWPHTLSMQVFVTSVHAPPFTTAIAGGIVSSTPAIITLLHIFGAKCTRRCGAPIHASVIIGRNSPHDGATCAIAEPDSRTRMEKSNHDSRIISSLSV